MADLSGIWQFDMSPMLSERQIQVENVQYWIWVNKLVPYSNLPYTFVCVWITLTVTISFISFNYTILKCVTNLLNMTHVPWDWGNIKREVWVGSKIEDKIYNNSDFSGKGGCAISWVDHIEEIYGISKVYSMFLACTLIYIQYFMM